GGAKFKLNVADAPAATVPGLADTVNIAPSAPPSVSALIVRSSVPVFVIVNKPAGLAAAPITLLNNSRLALADSLGPIALSLNPTNEVAGDAVIVVGVLDVEVEVVEAA